MSQHSEERLPESEAAAATRPGARILPFERPQSDLQRAIQQRAQEALDRDRERDREKRRPQPLKWLAIVAIASIPVVLMFGAVDGFLRAFYRVNEAINAAPPPAQERPAQLAPGSTQPGVVLLESYEDPSKAQHDNEASGTNPDPAATPPP